MYPYQQAELQDFQDAIWTFAVGAAVLAGACLSTCLRLCHIRTRRIVAEYQRQVAPGVGVSSHSMFAVEHKQPERTPLQRLEKIKFSGKVPDVLCCDITKSIMTDPVFLKGEGRTFERSAIEEHFLNSGNKGPYKNKVLSEEGLELISNVGIKSAIEVFVTKQEVASRARAARVSVPAV